MDFIMNITANLAPFKWVIVGISATVGIGCVLLAFKARKKKRDND